MSVAQRRRRRLLEHLDHGFNRAAWHGANLAGSIRGLTVRQALWRPGRGRHNIWEIVLHTAFWKHEVQRRLTGVRGGGEPFPHRGRDWPRLPATLDARAWRADVALLAREHRNLRAVVMALSPARLGRKVGNRRWTAEETILGMALHDVYHAGQIQLIKRLMRHR
jgi:DinB superfamily